MSEMKCQAGCISFDGGEKKHRRDCVYYPESLTKMWHDTEAKLEAERDALLKRVKAADALAEAVHIWQRDGFTVEAAVKMGSNLAIYEDTGGKE